MHRPPKTGHRECEWKQGILNVPIENRADQKRTKRSAATSAVDISWPSHGRDLAHAAELSSGCPIFELGGLVEVRPVMKLSM